MARTLQTYLMKQLTSVLILAGGLLAGITANATPFASCISNINNTIYFNLNEPGGSVTVTYENGSTNANFNGVTTGLSLPSGYQHFDFTGHTSYNISVYKAGNGIPTVLTNIARGAARGIAANVRGDSPYFGYVYSEIGGGGVVMMRSDGSGPYPGSTLKPNPNGSFTWTGNYQEYFISIAPDDSVLISDFQSPSQGGVILANPQMTSANLLLANDTGLASGDTIDFNHGDAESRAILTAGIGNNPTLWVIDGSYGNGSSIPFNTIMKYNLGTAVFANGTLPWVNQPDVIGASVNPSNLPGGGSTGYFRDGFAIGTNGYIYLTVDRNNLSNPNLQVYASDAQTLLWGSFFTNSQGQLKDYLITGTQQLPESGLAAAEMALSPDNRYIACIHDDNHLTIFSMTNGIPDVSTEYLISWTNNTSTLTAGRYVCWDAANNLWVASPVLADVAQITTGRTGTAITSGNASGPTGFQVLSPTEIDIASVQALAPQANSYPNYPLASTNTITRTGNISSPLSVPFTLSGTAPTGTYIVSVTNSINFAAGQSSTNVIVTAVTDGIPRPTTTAVMTLLDNGSGQYLVGFQNQATTFIVNTATPQLTVGNAATSMYKAYSNDYASIAVTRIGDTNVAVTTSAFTYGGAAVRNTDFASISTTVTFAKGDLTKTVKIAKPLVNGQTPVHTSNPTYTGDKTFTVTVPSGTGYNTYSSNNIATLKIIDNAYPTATVLYSNPLTDPNDAANWNTTALVGDVSASPDYNVDFGYDLTSNNGQSTANGLITLPPNAATSALRVTTGKQFGNEAAAVNLYLANHPFSGNYAVRFAMYIVQGQNVATSAEGPLFGINHDGLETNWWYSSGTLTGGPWTADGVWFWIDAWPGGFTTDYMEFTGISNNIPNSGWRRPATGAIGTYANVFKDPDVFTSVGSTSNAVSGLPANASPFVKPTLVGNWADVEIKNSNNVVTLSINKQQIFSLANTNTLFQSGNLMLGYETPGASATGAGPDAAAYFSDLQVVSLASAIAAPTITSTSVNGGTVTINFTSPNGGDTTTSFTVQSVGIVNGTFTDTAANITGGSGTFQATLPVSGSTQFYRIHHN